MNQPLTANLITHKNILILDAHVYGKRQNREYKTKVNLIKIGEKNKNICRRNKTV